MNGRKAYRICKVFGHSCKTSVKAPTLSEKDMLKIKKKIGGCSTSL
jgi:hypothetical protein